MTIAGAIAAAVALLAIGYILGRLHRSYIVVTLRRFNQDLRQINQDMRERIGRPYDRL